MTARIMLVALLALTACTKPMRDNGIASAGGVNPATTAAGGEIDQVAWAKCLREHGIQVQDPEPGGKPRVDESVPKEAMDAAADACRAYNPNWGKPPPPPDPAQVEQQRKFAQCMRDHGFNWADPGPDGRPVDAPDAGGRGHPTPAKPGSGQAMRECAAGAGMPIEGTDGPKGST